MSAPMTRSVPSSNLPTFRPSCLTLSSSATRRNKLSVMSDRIESRLKEERRFHPAAPFTHRARVTTHHAYAAMHRQSLDEPDVFWREQTADLAWRKPWTKFSEWTLPRARFFIGATLHVSESCLDRHL